MGVEFWMVENSEEGCLVFPILFHYPWKHRPFEALGAGVPSGHPLASASCNCIVTATVTITTPNIASAATMAITAS